VYHASKFIQLLGANWWRRQLGTLATVIAVSPGLVVGTGLGRHLDFTPDLSKIPDKLTVEEGMSVMATSSPKIAATNTSMQEPETYSALLTKLTSQRIQSKYF
jgi:hypothetical protein